MRIRIYLIVASETIGRAAKALPNIQEDIKMDKKYYVSMTDSFLSGWGMAENKISKYIVICDNLEQAREVA